MNIVPQSTPICMPAGMGVAMGYGMYGHPVMAGSMMMGSRAAQMYHRGLLFPAFENLDKVLKKLNQKLQSDPIPGNLTLMYITFVIYIYIGIALTSYIVI